MTTLRYHQAADILETVENAARAACESLDAAFPGHDKGGITSNFHGLLVEVLTHMLKGRSVLDGQRGHYTKLPELVVDNSFFGNPLIRGDAFLVTKDGEQMWERHGDSYKCVGREILVLQPHCTGFRKISVADDAWTSFEAAAEAAMTYLRSEGFSIEQARALDLQVQAVVADPTKDRGYRVMNSTLSLRAA
jgi:hypothetical protein